MTAFHFHLSCYMPPKAVSHCMRCVHMAQQNSCMPSTGGERQVSHDRMHCAYKGAMPPPSCIVSIITVTAIKIWSLGPESHSPVLASLRLHLSAISWQEI
jgi:hypothetical protein